MPGKLAKLDVDDAIEQIANGAISRDIAERYGVTSYAIRKRLADHPAYADALKARASDWVDSSAREVMDLGVADDAVAIARARVKADVSMRYAKAYLPEFQDKFTGHVSVEHSMDVQSVDELARRMAYMLNAATQLPHCNTIDNDAQLAPITDNSVTDQ